MTNDPVEGSIDAYYDASSDPVRRRARLTAALANVIDELDRLEATTIDDQNVRSRADRIKLLRSKRRQLETFLELTK